MVTLKINGNTIKARKGSTILEAARKAGEKVPTLCYINGLFPSGACRMCIVEIEGKAGLVPSCSYPVEEGMEAYTRSPRVLNGRRTIIELLLASHPFDCLTCPKNGHCELQSIAAEYGIERVPYKGKTRHHYTDFSSASIVRDPNKCILCGRCVRICEEVQGVSAIDFTKRGFDTMVLPPFEQDISQTTCVYCGQCVLSCPVGALSERSSLEEVIEVLQENGKYLVAGVAPAIRVSLGEFFGLEPGQNVTGMVSAALRKIGFQKVFDTDFTADLTIMEEASEFIGRIENGGELPLFTSCCPAWIKFSEQNFPELLPNISTCKSPQQMMGALVKHHLSEEIGIPPEDIYLVSIMPCTAKKYECTRPEMGVGASADVDTVLTTRELAKMIKIHGINFPDIEPEWFDDPIGFTSGSGDIFAASGGVMESALRTAYYFITGKDLEKIEFEEVRGFRGIKEASVEIGDLPVNVAVVNTLSNAREIIRRIQSGEKEYHFVEVMSCPGGCVGGGGQMEGYEPERIKQRIEAIYSLDRKRVVRLSYNNPAVTKLYDNLLDRPGSARSHELLHTSYGRKSKRN
ncbi:MAG TPA: NADH-dependent [FeFe] hydrogenase, group A6 [Spirochaetota bacterium]|nr:NADH-dependent [FeFe] hydrogenase, group A6 [Spirochaetota bacterium]